MKFWQNKFFCPKNIMFLPPFREHYIVYAVRFGEEWGNLLIPKACYATTYAGYEEGQVLMLLSKLYEFVHIGADGLHSSLHSGNGVALTLQSYTLSHDSTKLKVSHTSGSTTMHAS